MSINSEIRVGLVGCGNIGARGHAPAYALIPEARLVAACDLIPTRAEQVASTYNCVSYSDYRQLLDRRDIHMVDLCVPTSEHASLGIAALQAGKHVLCEKPITGSLSEADDLISIARETGLKIMIGHIRRFDPRYIEIKNALVNGDIGRLVYMRRAERQWLPFPIDAWYWHPDQGGGVILDIGVHIADLMRWYFAQEPTAVYAIGQHVRPIARQADTYDHALITFSFPQDAVGLAEASWAYPPEFGSSLYASLDLVGTLGKTQYSDLDSNPMMVFKSEGGAEYPRYFQFMSTIEQAFEAEIRHFIQCILKDGVPAVSLEDARAALEMVLAAKQSADTGQPVSFPYEEKP